MLTGFGAIVATAYIVITTYSPLPHWDEWTLFDHLATGGGWSLQWLWAQHNEHRILTTKLFFLLDVELCQGTQKFLLTTIFLVQLLQGALLSWSLRVLGGVRGSVWRTGTGLIAYCVFCPIQYENLVVGFQLQFVLTSAMATLAALSLLLYRRKSRPISLFTCIAAASVATSSLANGMVLWPLLIGAALLLGLRRSTSGILFGFGTLNIVLYFIHYRRSSTQGAPLTLRSAVEMAHYAIVYVGSTWVRHSSGFIALAAGSAGIGIGLVLIVRALRAREREHLLSIEFSLLILMVLATAVITSSGRLHLGVEQATASRYQTFALVFWCCLGLLLLLRAAASQARFLAAEIALLIIMLGFATQLRFPLIDAQWHQRQLKIISLSLLTGVNDPEILAEAYPDPQVVLRDATYMKQHRLSLFAGEQYKQLGRAVDSQYHVTEATACSGYVSSSKVLPSGDGQGLKLTGYAWNRQTQMPTPDIVVADNGHIAGFGTSVVIPYFRTRAKRKEDSARLAWIAFTGEASGSIQLYAITGENQRDACPLPYPRP